MYSFCAFFCVLAFVISLYGQFSFFYTCRLSIFHSSCCVGPLSFAPVFVVEGRETLVASSYDTDIVEENRNECDAIAEHDQRFQVTLGTPHTISSCILQQYKYLPCCYIASSVLLLLHDWCMKFSRTDRWPAPPSYTMWAGKQYRANYHEVLTASEVGRLNGVSHCSMFSQKILFAFCAWGGTLAVCLCSLTTFVGRLFRAVPTCCRIFSRLCSEPPKHGV